MIKNVLQRAPHVSLEQLVLTGATDIRRVFDEDTVPIIIQSYMDGLRVAFAIAIACVGFAFVSSFFSRWSRLNKDKITTGGAA